MNWFNFYPVGQGLFYCGLIDDGKYAFVYDCGTSTASVNIKNYIGHLKRHHNGYINFVVISHLHKDHTSGIVDLLHSFNVKKFYLPYLFGTSSDEFLLQIIYSYFGLDSEVDYGRTIEKRFEISKNDIENIKQLLNLYENKNQSMLVNENILFDYKISEEPYWYFFLACKKQDQTRVTDLQINIQNMLNNSLCNSVLEMLEKGHIEEIHDLYINVFGRKRINDTSIVMLHFPNELLCNQTFYYEKCFSPYVSSFYYKKSTIPFSLLTGDVNFSDELANNVLSLMPYGSRGFLQVPHHGAENEWNSFWKYFKGGDAYIVPFGTTNIYRHPFSKIESAVSLYKYYRVNEYMGFPYWIFD